MKWLASAGSAVDGDPDSLQRFLPRRGLRSAYLLRAAVPGERGDARDEGQLRSAVAQTEFPRMGSRLKDDERGRGH